MQQFPWLFLLIPVLFFVAWLLSLIFKPGDGKDDPRQAKRPGTDVDRFLAEARRRRQALEQQRQSAARPAAQAPTRPSPSPGQRPPDQQAQRFRDPYVATAGAPGQRPPLQPVATGRPVMLELDPDDPPQPPAKPGPPPVVKPVPKPVAKASENRPPSKPNAPAPPPPPPVASTIPPIVSGRDRPTSAVLTQVVKLLRSPQSAAVAVVLREILDRPRGNRPMHPPA